MIEPGKCEIFRTRGPALLAGLMLLSAQAGVFAQTMAYVPNQKSGNVSVIDTSTDTVVRTLSGQDAFGKRLQQIALDDSGKLLFVVDAAHDKLSALDIASDKVQKSIEIEEDAEGVTISPDGKTLAVCVEGSHHVLIVDAASLTIKANITTQGKNPEHCAFTPDGKSVVTSNEGTSNLDVIDLATNTSVGLIPMSGHPRGMGFIPGTSLLYVAQETANVVDVVDLGSRKKLKSIPTALRSAGVVVSADGKRVFVSNGGAGTISVIDVAKGASVADIKVGERPWNPALTPDGKKLYVANGRSNTVSVIDTTTLKVIKEIAVGDMPWGVVIGK